MYLSFGKQGRRPELDGIRGIAILLVVISHLGVRELSRLGETGVTVFFTLSGFLITSILLAEGRATQTIDLRAFYRRRLFRLAPAFVLMLALTMSLEYVLTGSVPYWWAPLLEVSNWIAAAQGPDALGLLHHTWTLAIEEQFYLVWPVVVLLAGTPFQRRRLITVAVLGIGASVTSDLILNGDQATYGTGTHATSLLVGCLLAAVLEDRPFAAPGFVMPGGLVLGIAVVAQDGPTSLVANSTALVIWSAASREHPWLAWRPLAGAGVVSYGWYLWNYPMAHLTDRLDGPMWIVPFASLAVALASWRYLERPILRLKSRTRDPVTAGV